MSRSLRRLLIAGAALVWCVLIGWGLRAMQLEATTSGAVIESPARWPAQTRLPRGDGFTIAMFVHPECPCSRASLHELAAIAAQARAQLDIVIAGAATSGTMWDAAGAVAGAARIADDGREAARFGARTSGYTVVYDRDGVRRFAGGITGARGHVGDNAGRQAVERIVIGGDLLDHDHPVFGCALDGGPGGGPGGGR